MEQFANTLNLKEMHQTLVICSPLPMPAGTPPSPWLFVLLICYFSLYLSSTQFTVWFSRPKSERVLTTCFWLFFPSVMTLFNLTPRIMFPKSSSPSHSSHLQTPLCLHYSHSPSSCSEGRYLQKAHQWEKAGIFPFFKIPIWKIHFVCCILSVRVELPRASVLRALGMASK